VCDLFLFSHPSFLFLVDREVEALEALTAAALTDVNRTTPLDYIRLRFGFAAPVAAELRVLSGGRQKLVLQTEQLVVQFCRFAFTRYWQYQ